MGIPGIPQPGGNSGNTWNTGLVPGSSNIWPGSNYNSGGGDSGPAGLNGGTGYNPIFAGFSGNRKSPLQMPNEDIPGAGGFGIGGSNNGLNLSGTWASSGFGAQQGPASGFNFFNPTSTSVPGGSTFSPTPFPANGIGSVGLPGVANPSSPFTTSGTGFGTTGTGTGFPGLPGVDPKSLDKIYGKGVGNALSQFLSSGAGFNPAVMQAQLNQAQPIENQTLSKMQTMFGDTGNAYSSTAAIGYGDFTSQFNAALEGQFANEYQQSVQNYLNVLMGVKGDAQQEQAQAPNWLSISSEIANSIVNIPGFHF